MQSIDAHARINQTSTSSLCTASAVGDQSIPLKLDSDAVLMAPHLPAIRSVIHHRSSPLFSLRSMSRHPSSHCLHRKEGQQTPAQQDIT
jgi:hypothetical protein